MVTPSIQVYNWQQYNQDKERQCDISMQKIFRFILFSSRKRRCLVVGFILWFLRQILDVEKDELYRNSDILDSFDLDSEGVSRRDYIVIEEVYSNCEYAVSVLESAIEDLEFVY